MGLSAHAIAHQKLSGAVSGLAGFAGLGAVLAVGAGVGVALAVGAGVTFGGGVVFGGGVALVPVSLPASPLQPASPA